MAMGSKKKRGDKDNPFKRALAGLGHSLIESSRAAVNRRPNERVIAGRVMEQASETGLSPGHGREAESPSEIPKRGWKDILWRVKREASDDAVGFQAAGVAFYLLVALVPALAALAGVYGLVADRSTVAEQVSHLHGLMPPDVLELIKTEMGNIAGQDAAAGWALVLGLGLAFWGGSKGMDSIIAALNVVYDEKETRGFVKRKLLSLGLTVGAIVFLATVVLLMVVAPVVLRYLGLSTFSESLISFLRWPVAFLGALTALAVLYRFAPCRSKPRWKWVAPGSALAALGWVLACAGLTLYYSREGGAESKTYGSLTAVVLLMTWFYISAYVVLMGGELNAETEHQTARDSTVGGPDPIGQRGAYVADTIGVVAGESRNRR